MKPIAFPAYIKSDRIYLKALSMDDTAKLFELINNQRDYIGEYLDWVDKIKSIEYENEYVI